MTIYTGEADNATKLQFIESGNAIDDPTFEIIGGKNAYVFIHEELHRLHLIKRVLCQENGRGSRRNIKLRKRHLVPYYTGLNAGVEMTKRGEPEALLGGYFGLVDEESAASTLSVVKESDIVCKSDDGCIVRKRKLRLASD